MNGTQPSGAYVFRPNGTPVAVDTAELEVVKGPLIEEVRQTFNPWIAQTIRLKKNAKHIEFDWIIGPIPKEESCVLLFIERFDLTSSRTKSGINHCPHMPDNALQINGASLRNPITKEVVARYSTDIKNEVVFYTDSNGRQMMRRQYVITELLFLRTNNSINSGGISTPLSNMSTASQFLAITIRLLTEYF
ncbi:hypothetical protein OESDEN_00406 [Oesophagostomum dentatum]|uniref:Glycosyl hydrolase family 38 C-terminal domain-containing protein n=1 Tax=Oesophagostomum dentatum TaxID=61180 RepID=A0A0B1TQY6_OESDE|nr:hypothetical protein OESDEN_00406 [Oesophagostomum dentatum]